MSDPVPNDPTLDDAHYAGRDGTSLDQLYRIIEDRRDADPSSSYTAKLLGQGRLRVAQKLGEEALETALAAATGERGGIIAESADLLYHLLVLWASAGIKPREVWNELARREGKSGLTEKAARSS